MCIDRSQPLARGIVTTCSLERGRAALKPVSACSLPATTTAESPKTSERFRHSAINRNAVNRTSVINSLQRPGRRAVSLSGGASS